MTNLEKAIELARKHEGLFGMRNREECCVAACQEMAEWKDEQIKEILLAYTKWLDKRWFFKEDLQCDFLHQIETFLEMKGCEE